MRSSRVSLRGSQAIRTGLLIALVSGCSLSCGPAARSPSSAGSRDCFDEADEHPRELVQHVDSPDRPHLTLVRRAGDPRGAVAVAVFPPGGTRSSLALLALLELRLEQKGYGKLELSPHGLGLIVASEVESPEEGAGFIDAVREALLTSVEEGDASLARAGELLRTARARAGEESAYEECLGSFNAEGVEPLKKELDRDELNRVRSEAANGSRVGFAALGDGALLDAIAKAHDDTWPSGDPIADPWPSEDVIRVLPNPQGQELRLAVRVEDGERALAAAHALARPEHPLHARLHALGGHFVARPSQVTLRPASACLGVILEQGSETRAAALPQITRAALVAQEELGETLRAVRPEDETTLALLAPESALEAVALAAWTSVRATSSAESTRRVLELRAPPTDKTRPTVATLERSLRDTSTIWEKQQLEFLSASEPGQSEAWLLVASRCGSRVEPVEEAGLRALTVRSLAADFSGVDGVILEPWITAEGIGLLAHAPRLRGENGVRHGSRLARAVARAFAGDPLDGRDVARMRALQLDQLGDNPGRALIHSIVSAGRASALEPLGTSASLETSSTADVERTRATLIEEPLRISFLGNSGPNQVEATQRSLSAWLAPFRESPLACKEEELHPVQPGTWTLETVEPEIRPGTFLGVFHPAPREYGQALAYLLNRPGGYLDQSLTAPGLIATAEARWLGGEGVGGLVITLAGESEQLPTAEHQARALLARLAQGELTEEDAEQARAAQVERDERGRASPRGRVVELWQGKTQRPVSRAALSEFLRGFAAERHLIVRVRSRK